VDGLGENKRRAMSSPPVELSVVIPFYNEAPNVAPLLAELRATLRQLRIAAEAIAVDDGSIDDTARQLEAQAAEWPELRVVRQPRNGGQALALWTGFAQARGEWLAMLDGDGQNPPAELARLWALRDTADLIAGARQHRQDSALRRTMSRTANAVRRRLLRDGVSDTGCSLKLFRREVARAFVPLRTMYSFLPAMAVAAGFSVREVPVAHRPRTAGVSKYGLRAMAVLPLLDTLTLCWILRRIPRWHASKPPGHP
jgi:dolichol-phosphate mannosyltransferase